MTDSTNPFGPVVVLEIRPVPPPIPLPGQVFTVILHFHGLAAGIGDPDWPSQPVKLGRCWVVVGVGMDFPFLHIGVTCPVTVTDGEAVKTLVVGVEMEIVNDIT